MTDAAKVASTTIKPNQSLIVGLIDVPPVKKDFQGRTVFVHRVVQPAADAYSSPGAVIVEAGQRLGGVGEEVRVMCAVTGWKDSFNDKQSGDKVNTARMVCRAIEQ